MTGAADTGIKQDLVIELLDLVEPTLVPPGRVKEVQRRPNGFSTKLSSEFVTIVFHDRPPLPLFVKKVVDDTAARHPSPPDTEVRVYESLGNHPAFAAPGFMGTIGGPDSYLVLAAVEGWDLRYHEIDRWIIAARDLGAMHAALSEDFDSLFFDGLERRGRDSYLGEAELAASIAAGQETATGVGPLESLADGYAALAEELTRQPETLIHGDLAPKNVMVDRSKHTERILFVDWEWAAIGPGPIDLADLVNGLDEGDEALVTAAYIKAASGTALPAEEDAAVRCIELARLQRILLRITRSADWQVSPSDVLRWAREAASLYEKLLRAS